MTTRDEWRSWAWWQKAVFVACAVAAGVAVYVVDTVTGRRP